MIQDYTGYTIIDPESRITVTDSPQKFPLSREDIDRIREEAAKTGMRVIISRSEEDV